MRLNTRSRVDFPRPDGPIKAVTRFSGTSMLMCLTAWNLSYQKFRSRADTFTGGASGSAASRTWGATAGRASFMGSIRVKLVIGASVIRDLVAQQEGARDQADREHEQRYQQGTGPGQVFPVLVAGAGELVHDQRHRTHGAGGVEAEEFVAEGG